MCEREYSYSEQQADLGDAQRKAAQEEEFEDDE